MAAITVTATVRDSTGATASATATADIATAPASDLGPAYIPVGDKVLWGATPARMGSQEISPENLAALEAKTGRALQAVRIFYPQCNVPWFQPGSDELLMGDGRVVFLSAKTAPYTPAQVAAGAADSAFEQRAGEALLSGRPVVVTFDHESDGGPGGPNMTAAEYAGVTKRWARIFQRVAPSVGRAVVFTSFANNMPWVRAAWPDTDPDLPGLIDWLGADPYTFRTSATTRVTPQSLSSMLADFMTWAEGPGRAGKAVALTEWGCADDPTNGITDGGAGKAAWFRASRTWLDTTVRGRRVKAALYYHSPGTVPTTPVDSTAASLAAWQEISDPTRAPRTVVKV